MSDAGFAELEPATPPLTDEHGRLRLSFTRIDTYQNCPRRFRFTYLDRLPTAPSPALSFGSSIHRALERFHDRPLPGRPSEEALLEALFEGWEQGGFAALPREEQLAYYRHAQQVLRRYHAREEPSDRRTVTTEAWFELPIGDDVLVVGSIDRIDIDDDGAFHLVDYKTNRKARPRSAVAGSLQLSLYALACHHLYGQLPATVCLDFVVPGVEVVVSLSELDLDDAHRQVQAAATAIRAERFPTTPNRLCDWCDHRQVCPAWEGDPEPAYAAAVLEADQRRRRLSREVRELRELEEGLARLAAERDLDR